MKRIVIFFLIVTTIMGCSKGNDNTLNNNSCVVASIHYQDYFIDTETHFDYDAKGRITRARVRESDIWRQDYKFDYQDEAIVVEIYGEQETLVHTITYYLENNKVSSFYYGSGKMEYEYNSANLISKYTDYYDQSTTVGHIEYTLGINDNIGQASSDWNNYGYNYVYNYNTNEPRVPFIEFYLLHRLSFGMPHTISLQNAVLYEQGYFGHKSKNQVTGYTHTETRPGSNIRVTTPAIEYGAKDAKGNFTSATSTIQSTKITPATQTTINLTYKCD